MNVKRWFPWACLAMMLAADIFLFRANRQKDAVVINLHDAQVRLHQTEDELSALKASDVGRQASELLRLRKQNEILNHQFASLEATLASVEAQGRSNADHLVTARLAIRLQQQHLRELEKENASIMQVAVSSVTNAAAIIAKRTCLANLRRIDDAKQAWAADSHAPPDAVPHASDLLPYLNSSIFPACPSGGRYSINAVNETPTCSFPGHAFHEETPAPPPPGP